MTDTPRSPVALTPHLQRCIARFRAGDIVAGDELLRRLSRRLEMLARRMLRGFPVLRGCVELDDVLQNAKVRLLRALQEVQPASLNALYGLAVIQVRRDLLDRARRLHRRTGRLRATVDDCEEPGELERWASFHEALAQLPVAERELVGLVFYHGWTQLQISELFGVTVRTIQRRWRSALKRLRRLVANDGA